MAATTALRNAALGLTQTGHYVGLISAVTNELAGSVTEVSVASYARQPVTWSAITAGAYNNATQITFPTTSGSGTYRYVGLWDSASGGVLKYVWDTGATQTYSPTVTPQIAAAAISLDDNRTT